MKKKKDLFFSSENTTHGKKWPSCMLNDYTHTGNGRHMWECNRYKAPTCVDQILLWTTFKTLSVFSLCSKFLVLTNPRLGQPYAHNNLTWKNKKLLGFHVRGRQVVKAAMGCSQFWNLATKSSIDLPDFLLVIGKKLLLKNNNAPKSITEYPKKKWQVNTMKIYEKISPNVRLNCSNVTLISS